MWSKLNSVAWVREPTIPTERPPLVDEVSAKFVDRRSHVVSVTDPYGRILGFLDRSRYFFLPSSSSVVLTRLSGPHSRPTNYQKNLVAPGIEPWRLELWPLDHRGGEMWTSQNIQSFNAQARHSPPHSTVDTQERWHNPPVVLPARLLLWPSPVCISFSKSLYDV
jgi:hypothetical protein